MQYFLLPAALVTASGMLANAAPLNGVNKDAADLQPLAAPATNAGEPLVVQWKPAAKNSAWKHMDVSLVALLANGKQHERQAWLMALTVLTPRTTRCMPRHLSMSMVTLRSI